MWAMHCVQNDMSLMSSALCAAIAKSNLMQDYVDVSEWSTESNYYLVSDMLFETECMTVMQHYW